MCVCVGPFNFNFSIYCIQQGIFTFTHIHTMRPLPITYLGLQSFIIILVHDAAQSKNKRRRISKHVLFLLLLLFSNIGIWQFYCLKHFSCRNANTITENKTIRQRDGERKKKEENSTEKKFRKDFHRLGHLIESQELTMKERQEEMSH